MTDHLAGCSLDFDVDDFEGFGELKCPKTAITSNISRAVASPRRT